MRSRPRNPRGHQRYRATFIVGIVGIFLIFFGAAILHSQPASAAELVSTNYQFGDLRLNYQPPSNNGGEAITRYKIEWDAGASNVSGSASGASFTPSSQTYGTAEVTNIREEQDIIVTCRSTCTGTFSLSWGGRIIESLTVDSTAEEVEAAINYLVAPFNIFNDGSSAVKVTRKVNGFAYKWRVTFMGVAGDIGLMKANGDLLVGVGAAVIVEEVTTGSSDLYPGAYTNEIQTISVRKRKGFGCETLAGSFALSFEGKITSQIDVDTSADELKSILESLETIHSVNVRTDHHTSIGPGDCSSRSWIVTFTNLVHETEQASGDLREIQLYSSSLTDPTVTEVHVSENVKGTHPRAFSILGLIRGLLYYCRVSAYNALGYGISSTTVSGTPMNQPPAPRNAIVSHPDAAMHPESEGTSLKVSWQPASENGGGVVTDYKIDWYSATNDLEVQKLTTSSSNGITEVQSIKLSADTNSITGFFTLSFNGETTELISHDAEADGEESVEAKLERLSTIGDVEVSRDLSLVSIPDVEFDLTSASNVISRSGGSYSGTLNDLISIGDTIQVGGEVHTVSTVGSTTLFLDAAYAGPSALSIHIHKWSYGYEWTVTFTSHVGEQPLLIANPANSWAGTNPTIEVRRVQKGSQPLSGTFRLGHGDETTIAIPFDADANLVKQALEALNAIGEVNVERYDNNNGYNYFITFISDLGDIDQLTIDDSQLTGPDARARVATLTDGVAPSNYGSVIFSNFGNSATLEYKIDDLENGVPYYIRVRGKNAKGYGYAVAASSSPMAPMWRSSSPTSLAMVSLSESRIRVSWRAPEHNGGASIKKYAVQWDTDPSFPSAWVSGFYHEKYVETADEDDTLYCHTFGIDPASAHKARYGRVLAYNGYKWSQTDDGLTVHAVVGTPGPVRNFNAFPSSSIGIMLQWQHPAIDDEETCDYAGDGGSAITHYVIEYDVEADFSSPATAVTVPSSSTEFRIGGRDVLSGAESSALNEGGTYYARIVPFNAVGPGVMTTFPSAIGPLADDAPSAPVVISAYPVSATSVRVDWDTPSFDGGSSIEEFLIEYDVDSSFTKAPRNVSIAAVSEAHALQIESQEPDLNVHIIQATVEVTNEIQSVKTRINGVDEVQKITTSCDDVTAEVQMIVTTAVDTNEEQTVALVADDIDEIQLVRLKGDAQHEIQSVQVSVPRLNEIQKLGIVISNINTDGDGIQSTACTGLNVGDSCRDIEDSLSGSFTVSFDFDSCGGGGGNVNYCQLALSEYETGLGIVSCSPGLVTNPFAGGNHCVSEPVIHSFSSSEGDVGTLQYELNNLVDDNGLAFMTAPNMPVKQEAVTVSRQGRIKTKGSCVTDPLGLSPATCSGEYELLYEITFDAFHTSGDVPPVTVVASDFQIDTASSSYTTAMCPSSFFALGCELPTGAALDSNHGSFYNGESGSEAIEFTKGAQPSGFISLDYECESSVVRLPGGFFMLVSADGMTASFDTPTYVGGITPGQWLRFNAGDGIDHYRKISGIDTVGHIVSFEERAPTLGASYTDVEFGDYYSDWSEANGVSGVSSHCASDRIRTTLPIDVNVHNPTVSETDWRGKIGALHVVDSSGVAVSRYLALDLSTDVGLIWDVTFQKQPGNVHEMACQTFPGNNECTVSTLQDSSAIQGSFKLQTTWPHEYVTESPQLFETDAIRWNAIPIEMKSALEAITDVDGNKVFGTVHVTRSPYTPPGDLRWSGGYTWTITFLSRGGNIPALSFDDSALTGLDITLAVSDEDSGDADLYQGSRNSASFADDPGLARDGNQITGSFSLSWPGNAYHGAVTTGNVFTVQTMGASSEYTALSADAFKALFEEHVLQGATDQVDVIRSDQPTQWMGYSYTIKFRHEDVGGDVPGLVYAIGSSTLDGRNSHVQVSEAVKGTELTGTFQLRFEGETTRPITHDATALDIQNALNELNSIAPSTVLVSGGSNPVRSGPADGIGGSSTQVKGRIWYVTFASNVWRDPTIPHDSSFVPGNWIGPSTTYADTWSSGFSKAWGKNVGNVPMISCLSSGLTTTNGALPDDGCTVSEVVAGTDPLGGVFKICLDTASNPNGVMSVESDSCTDFIAHNAVASAVESGGDGSSVEEKLESLANVGDVHVTRSSVNMRNGGYTWTVQFLRDIDGPCEQKDDLLSLCNAPGNVPKLCSGSTPCDVASLKGSCQSPGYCSKLTVLDALDHQLGLYFPGGVEKQIIYVKDSEYLGWEDGSVVSSAVTKEYRLVIAGASTACISHNAIASEMASIVQDVLDGGIGGTVRVDRTQMEDAAENGFVYYLTFYDAGDVPLLVADFSGETCSNDFEATQSVLVVPVNDGDTHAVDCQSCVDGVVLRGDFQRFEVEGDVIAGNLPWNAEAHEVKHHLEQAGDRTVHVVRTVLDKYGAIEWTVTFSENPNTYPPGSGNVADLSVVQDPDTSGQSPTIEVSEVARGSDGLGGTFDLDYQASGGPRTFSFDERSQRMLRKLEEMSTVGRVFVTRDCYPSCTDGGWGGNPVVSGTMGGYQWKIYFLTNPGSDNGFTFPPGSGVMNAPSVDDSRLDGEKAAITASISSLGGSPITGAFHMDINGYETGAIPHNIDSYALEQTINDLGAVGQVSVESGYQADFLIPGVTATVATDGTVASIVGDLRERLAPGSSFRLGGSHEFDGAEPVGSAITGKSSPILSHVQLTNRNHLFVGEQVRIESDTYSIVRNGIEVQQLTVQHDSAVIDGEAYQLSVTIGGANEVTPCLSFDATAADVEAALNSLPSLSSNGGVLVTRTENTSGLTGDAHHYKIYFTGDGLLGDVNEIAPQYCSSGVPLGMDSSNSHFHIRTLIQGGKTEHQQISLASDSGTTNDTPAFQLTVTDSNANSWTSPCYKWGSETLDLATLIESSAFATVSTLSVNTVTNIGNGQYNVETTGFVEGIVLVGDFVHFGDDCTGEVLTIVEDGKSVVIETSAACNAAPGDGVSVASDKTIIDTFIDNGRSISELSMLSIFADAEIESEDGLFKLSVEFGGVTRSTSCLRYGASEGDVQQEIDALFDFNSDGSIDANDANHVRVTRKGDGSSASGFGYTYEFLSAGSPTLIGTSSVLGSSAPRFSVVDIGSDGGCADSGAEYVLVSTTVSTSDSSDTIILGLDAAVAIRAGDKLRLSSSLESSKVYTVDHTSIDGRTLVLTENFVGSSTAAASLHLIRGGTPQFNVEILRQGIDEFVYDIFFTGTHWRNAPQIQLNTFGDGSCPASFTDIQHGMNRNIGVKTMSDGGGTIAVTDNRYVLNRPTRRNQVGSHSLYVVPPMFTVHWDSSEVQSILIMDADNAAIWSSGQPSYKLSFGGEYTGCIAHDALDAEVEAALNSLSTLCSGSDACVTVTRKADPVRAPNGHVYTVYFDSSAAARTNINDPGVGGLEVDASHSDCTAFDSSAGEQISLVLELQGQKSLAYDAYQIPFSLHQRWIGESQQSLHVYRVSGSFWTVCYEQSLGSVNVDLLPGTLSGSATAYIEVASSGVNPNHATISGLSTGIPYYFRAFSRSSYDFSSSSNFMKAIPSDRPEQLHHLSAGHSLHRNEVQLVTIAAKHRKEVQVIRTSAMTISEVQEVSLVGTPGSEMSSYLFSLRQPEIQVVKWSSESPVTSGSFFLKLMYVDRTASDLSGNVVYKELQSPCIPFDATADEVKLAIEAGAVMNGLGVDSVRVLRSGNRSFSSDYGYTYEIHFVGSGVRGNMLEFTSDIALTGIDSSGGATCDAFVSLTNDASLEIWTKNDSLALGTDTARAEIILDTNVEVFDGEFQISITYLGQQLTTECIAWDASADQVKLALDNLNNVDSVRVDKMDDESRYVIYFDGNAMHTNQRGDLGFQPQQGNFFVSTSGSNCQPVRAYHNNVLKQVDEIPGATANAQILNVYDGGDNLPGAAEASSSLQISSTLASSLPMIITEARVTQSLETSNNGVTFTTTFGNSDGNVPLLVCNHVDTLSYLASCEANTVMDGNIIGGSFYLDSSDPIPHDASALEMEDAISGIFGIENVAVTRSQADGQGGYTWEVTFIDDHGDVPLLHASNSLTGKGASVSVTEAIKGNELGGVYSLIFGTESTVDLPFDAPAADVQSALKDLPNVVHVNVELVSSIDSEGGRTFAITFKDPDLGDIELMSADTSQLTGLGSVVAIFEHIKGSLASRDSLHLSFELPRSCSTSDVGLPTCGDSITEVEFELSPNPGFTGNTLKHTYHPDYTTQIIRTAHVSSTPTYPLSGYFHVAYNGFASDPINAQASETEVRLALESIAGIETARVERSFASQEVPGVCIDLDAGSSTVYCSPPCSPCNFRSNGIIANQLIKIGSQWFRVSSAYDGSQESFTLASEQDSFVSKQYVEDTSLRSGALHSWTGGYEWAVSLLSVVGDIKPLTTPIHHLLPSDAAIDISTKDCDQCMYVNDLMPGTEYSIKGRVQNSRGNSEYSDIIAATPRGIPTAPNNVQVNAISSTCIEVTFHPPIHGEPFLSYTVQWDYNEYFSNAQEHSASCSSLRYGSCAISMNGSSPFRRVICGLVDSEAYYVRVAVSNDIQVQPIYPSGNPRDNTNWATMSPTLPSNQVPDPPSALDALVLGQNGAQLLFDWPNRDGGQAILHFEVSYDTSADFSTAQVFSIDSTVPQLIPASGDQFVFDFVPTSPQLDAGVTYFITLAAVNSVGKSAASSTIAIVPSGPSSPPQGGSLTTLLVSEMPISEATISWTPPVFNGGYPIEGYVVEWWSKDKRPEVQTVRLQYNTLLSATTFTLSFSPTPTLKKVTSNLPWNAPADLVRRELLNLGWDVSDDSTLLSDIEVTRTTLAKGYQWAITFGNNPDRPTNDGDQVSLVGYVMANGDLGSPAITVSTAQDGQRLGGVDEVQYLQVVGTGDVSGYYRIKAMGSEWTSFIHVHANAAYIKSTLDQLSTVGEVDVIQNDGVDQSAIGTGNNLVHHYEIYFRGNSGNVDALIVDVAHVTSSNDDANILVYNGNNALNSQNTKLCSASPGEVPVDYGSSGLLKPTDDSYKITGLKTGKEYFVTVSAKSPLHGLSTRLIPTPASIVPTLQTPGSPQNVILNVNSGFSDSLLVDFDPPVSNGGSDILFYRVELDPTASFDNPIVQDFQCPPSNKKTEWVIETSVDGSGVISGGSFTLEVEVDGFTSATSEIPYDSVALASNETGISEELIPTFSTTSNSNTISTIPSTNIESILFPGDRLRFSGQSTLFQHYEVVSVTGTGAILSNPFEGSDGVQVSTARHYGGRGTPLASRIHCQYDPDLCPYSAEYQSGSLQSKLEDLTSAIHNGVYVDRDGPKADNGFIWRVTFLDDARSIGKDYQLRVRSNSLVTYGNQGAAQVSISLLNSGSTYLSCSGSLVMPSYGGLVKGLEYYGRVSARNSEGYSIPLQAPEPVAPKIVPAAPTGVSLSVASSTSLRLMFGSPSDNGGDSITGYLVEWSTSSAFVNSQSTEVNNLSMGSPFFASIEGLTTGTFHFVRVKAKNSQGYGVSQMSTPSSLNPHQRPSPPTNVRLGVTADTLLTVGWDHPISNGGDTITKYRVEWDTNPSFSTMTLPPNKGYIDVSPAARSHTIQLLSSAKNYYVRVQAYNTAGDSTFQTSTPSDASPRLQPPGSPHTLQVVASPSVAGRIEVSWQRPRIPWHGIPCANDETNIIDCPTPYGGSLPSSDGGEEITEYELEYNERRDFLGTDGGRKSYTGTTAVIDHLYSGRTYFVRVLARNSIGSGKYCEPIAGTAL